MLFGAHILLLLLRFAHALTQRLRPRGASVIGAAVRSCRWRRMIVLASCCGCGARAIPPRLPPSASPQQTTRASVVALSTLRLEFGTVQAGSVVESVVYVTNKGPEALEIAMVDSTCDCVTFTLPRRDIAAEERIAAKVQLDLSREPEFVGRLAVDVRGVDAEGAASRRTTRSSSSHSRAGTDAAAICAGETNWSCT